MIRSASTVDLSSEKKTVFQRFFFASGKNEVVFTVELSSNKKTIILHQVFFVFTRDKVVKVEGFEEELRLSSHKT